MIHHGIRLDERSPEDHTEDISSVCPDCVYVTKLCKGLREFGYDSLTIAGTREAYEVAIQRKPTAEDGIIAMLIHSQLVEAGLRAGE